MTIQQLVVSSSKLISRFLWAPGANRQQLTPIRQFRIVTCPPGYLQQKTAIKGHLFHLSLSSKKIRNIENTIEQPGNQHRRSTTINPVRLT